MSYLIWLAVAALYLGFLIWLARLDGDPRSEDCSFSEEELLVELERKEAWIAELEGQLRTKSGEGASPGFYVSRDMTDWEARRAKARESALRLINHAFRNPGRERPRLSIPARHDYDDDLIVCDFIGDAAARIERLEEQLAKREARIAELENRLQRMEVAR